MHNSSTWALLEHAEKYSYRVLKVKLWSSKKKKFEYGSMQKSVMIKLAYPHE